MILYENFYKLVNISSSIKPYLKTYLVESEIIKFGLKVLLVVFLFFSGDFIFLVLVNFSSKLCFVGFIEELWLV